MLGEVDPAGHFDIVLGLMLNEDDCRDVIAVTTNLLAATPRPARGICSAALDALVTLLGQMLDGTISSNDRTSQDLAISDLLVVLKEAYGALPGKKGNVLTCLVEYGAVDLDQAGRIAEAAKIS